MILTTEELLDIPLPDRVHTGVKCLDDALGGGYVPGTVILLTGVPGVGKSTLLLKAVPDGSVYNNNEESAASFAYKARSAGILPGEVSWVFGRSLRSTFEIAIAEGPSVLVVDSIQETDITDSVAVAEACHNFATATGITVFLVGHVNKKGKHFGEERVRHWVDAHLHLVERDEIVVLKNRFPALMIEDHSIVVEPNLTDQAEVVPPTLPQKAAPRHLFSKVINVINIVLIVLLAPFALFGWLAMARGAMGGRR